MLDDCVHYVDIVIDLDSTSFVNESYMMYSRYIHFYSMLSVAQISV